MNRLAEMLGKLFKDEKAVRDVLNFIITLVIILAAALLIGNVFFAEEEEQSPVIFDNDSQAIDAENLYMEEEQRMSDILSEVKGVGDVKVMLTYGEDERGESSVKGVVVVAQGAGDIITKNKIITAAQSAFDIPVSRITVLESK
ncbi:MAG: hypothetical protein IJC41_02315 [Firmicutes bacterium]|nr:hypothetical protein [Clostridiales bacterium]MBQ2845695.1 hypothetical protein [Bacillota bacterium]MBQ4339813.1 hypothetical protein [Bacillota bacterium]